MQKKIRVWVTKFKGMDDLRLQWLDPITGKRKTKSAETSDRKAAKDKAVEQEYKLNHGIDEEPDRMPWSKFRDLYEAEEGTGRTEKGLIKIRTVFNSFERLICPKTMENVSERAINRFVSDLRNEGRSPATIKGYLAHLKAALRWAVRQKLIRRAPHIEMPIVPKNTNRQRIQTAARITGEEFDRLLKACPTEGWRLLLMLGWHCGMRRSEACKVRGEDINLETHKIHVPTNKANDAAASVFITPELDEYLRKRWPDGIPHGRLIRDSEVPGTENQVSKAFSKIAKKSTVRGNSRDGFITLHDLRRSYGSRWAGRVNAQVLRAMMRHSTINVTLDYYADVDGAAMEAIWNPSHVKK